MTIPELTLNTIMRKKTVAPPLYYRANYLTKIENIGQRIYTAIKTYEIDVF